MNLKKIINSNYFAIYQETELTVIFNFNSDKKVKTWVEFINSKKILKKMEKIDKNTQYFFFKSEDYLFIILGVLERIYGDDEFFFSLEENIKLNGEWISKSIYKENPYQITHSYEFSSEFKNLNIFKELFWNEFNIYNSKSPITDNGDFINYLWKKQVIFLNGIVSAHTLYELSCTNQEDKKEKLIEMLNKTKHIFIKSI